MQSKMKTDFLFARPSLASGCARIFDWHALYDSYNQSETEAEADEKAIFSDWSLVGLDILAAMDQFSDTETK
jgi:hypothetical protein